MLQIIIYLTAYIIGVVLGSFFTLATYRIPLKQDITHKRSYCPRCNHELGFWDLIPILSYLFLGGKCRYCKEKYGARYIIIEFFSGLFYLLFIVSLKIDFLRLSVTQIMQILNGTLLISVLFIIGGIAKETGRISRGTAFFGVICQIVYMVYLCILKLNIYRYIMYLLISFLCGQVLATCIYYISKKKLNLIYYFCFLSILSLIITNFIYK